MIFAWVYNDVSKNYNAMDVFVFPSLYEGLGMVLIEAQINGLPCLISDKVPKNVKFNSNVEVLEIKDDVKNYLSILLRHYRTENINENLKIEYNINYQSFKLAKKYLKEGE